MTSCKKNLVLLIPQLRHGGAERVVSRLSFLLNDDFNVQIVVFDDSVITYEIGCKITSLHVPSVVDSRLPSKVINVIKRLIRYRRFKLYNNVDITYSFGDTANIINILSCKQDRKVISIRGFKRVRTGKTPFEKFILRPISKYLCNKADRIVSVSELITKTLENEYKIQSCKVYTVYNGYDVENIQKLSKEEISENESNVFECDVLITAGTFRQEKGYWHLIKALSLVTKENQRVKLVIIGEDYRNNKQKVILLAEELGISDSVILLGYKENPFMYFYRSKLYVLSSVFEGFPNALVEAMACGLPVVASDCQSGPREILAPKTDIFKVADDVEIGEFGILINKMNPTENYDALNIEACDVSLARGILKLLDESNNSEFKTKAIKRSNEFSYQSWIAKQKEVLEWK